MLKHLSGILAVSALFAGTMAIAPMSGTAHAQFVPYSGPYRQPPPPPHTLPETIPSHRGDLRWVPGYWRWSGNGYQWQSGHLSRKPNLRHA